MPWAIRLSATLASKWGQLAKWHPYRLRLLVGCAAASGIAAAYDAPHPTPESKTGLLMFPELVPTGLEHPSAAKMIEVREALKSWDHPTLVFFGDSDPIFPPVVAERFAVRVMVTDVWDQVVIAVEPTTTVAELKREALTRALRRPGLPLDEYVVKFRGAALLDESATLAAVGAGPNAPFIILPARRQPVR